MTASSPSPFLLAACGALVLSFAAAAPAAAAPPKAMGSYAFFQPTPDDEDYAGQTVVVLRTDRALPLTRDGNPKRLGRVLGFRTFLSTISRDLHCYEMRSFVHRKGKGRATRGKVGDRVRVLVGAGGAILDRRMKVRKASDDLQRGGALGCGADPASGAVFFNLHSTPKSQPGQIFLTANSGPYITDITWTGWGTEPATATGTYISDCASCGEPKSYAVTLVADQLIPCEPYGAQAYNRWTFERAGGAAPGDPKDRGIDGEAELYC